MTAYESKGAALIASERQRQIEQEGWTPEHDAEHDRDDLARAAVCYATPPHLRPLTDEPPGGPVRWPWERRFWKPTPRDRVRELVKAGALIAAEIDRLSAKRDSTPSAGDLGSAAVGLLLSVCLLAGFLGLVVQR